MEDLYANHFDEILAEKPNVKPKNEYQLFSQ